MASEPLQHVIIFRRKREARIEKRKETRGHLPTTFLLKSFLQRKTEAERTFQTKKAKVENKSEANYLRAKSKGIGKC